MLLALTFVSNTKDGTLMNTSRTSPFSLERSLLSLRLHHELNQPHPRWRHSCLSSHLRHLVIALQSPRCHLTLPFAPNHHHRDRHHRLTRTGTGTVTAIAIGTVVVVIPISAA